MVCIQKSHWITKHGWKGGNGNKTVAKDLEVGRRSGDWLKIWRSLVGCHFPSFSLFTMSKNSFTDLLEGYSESEQEGQGIADFYCRRGPKLSDLQFLQHRVIGQSTDELC